MPFFSIIIPTYNRAAFLPKAIESVVGQTFTDWELIIVDDGSTDTTKEVVLSYKNERILYVYQENAERSVARNNGIHHAQGNFICFMDSDNVMESNRLEFLCQQIKPQQNKMAVFYTDIQHNYPDNQSRNFCTQGRSFGFPIDYEELAQVIIATPQLCIATQILREYAFNPAITIGEDMELLFRIVQKYPIIYLPKNATIIEVEHQGRSVASRSTSSEKQFKALDLMFKTAGNKLLRKNKRKLKSAVLLNASYTYLQEHKIKGLSYLLRSIIVDPQSKHTKYKCNLLKSFFFSSQHLKDMIP